jgi:AcrR family transcriptional regulator
MSKAQIARVTPKGNATITRIIDCAIDSIINGGADVVMTDIGRITGLSRTTLYRYFPTREALLEGVLEETGHRFEDSLRSAVAARPGPAIRIEVMAAFMAEQIRHGPYRQIFKSDPAFMLKLIERTMPQALDLAAFALEPLFAMSAALTGRAPDRDLICQLCVRFFTSLIVLPAPAPTGDLEETFRNMLRSALSASSAGQ